MRNVTCTRHGLCSVESRKRCVLQASVYRSGPCRFQYFDRCPPAVPVYSGSSSECLLSSHCLLILPFDARACAAGQQCRSGCFVGIRRSAVESCIHSPAAQCSQCPCWQSGIIALNCRSQFSGRNCQPSSWYAPLLAGIIHVIIAKII